MKGKEIAMWVVIFVISSLIVTAIVNPEFRKDIQQSLDKSNDNVEITKEFSISNNCQDKVKELVPKYLAVKLSYTKSQIEMNYWNDGTYMGPLKEDNLRAGSEEGENINYLYYGKIGYSKEIISEEGVILGDNTFSIIPIFDKDLKHPFYIKENQDLIQEGGLQVTSEGEEPDAIEPLLNNIITWNYFDGNIQQILNTDKIIIKKFFYPFGVGNMGTANPTQCLQETISGEKGQIVHGISEECRTIPARSELMDPVQALQNMDTRFTPDISGIYDIYEIISYEIVECDMKY